MTRETVVSSTHLSVHTMPDWLRAEHNHILNGSTSGGGPAVRRSVRGTSVASRQPKESSINRTSRSARHTVRFRGRLWKRVFRRNFEALLSAFMRDVCEGTGLYMKDIRDVDVQFLDVLVFTLLINHTQASHDMHDVHSCLKSYAYPRTMALYPMR
ncbi:hypothetical protein TRVL_08598 [Trypanosoma vivax]|uniref:Flagellar attachment zone protein 1 conserved domain-containing protein n=1 Tax=Trypanosoma vivax (strain Y486) TaxID=1055687 RepID=G0U1V3_TRYVY|nr:hypothetical protein TRVL_08598 [Trypanosoma vivax]CCC50252.1 conserved hypothetical protein [Trypanosoma vivax Y486]